MCWSHADIQHVLFGCPGSIEQFVFGSSFGSLDAPVANARGFSGEIDAGTERQNCVPMPFSDLGSNTIGSGLGSFECALSMEDGPFPCSVPEPFSPNYRIAALRNGPFPQQDARAWVAKRQSENVQILNVSGRDPVPDEHSVVLFPLLAIFCSSSARGRL